MNSIEPEPALSQIWATTPGGGGGGGQGTEVSTAEVTLDAAPNPVPEGTWATVTTTLSPTLNEHVTIPLTVTRVSSDDEDHGTLASVTVTFGNATATSTITTTTEDTDRDIVIGQYFAMRSVGVYVRAGWKRSKDQIPDKARMIQEPLRRELETTVWEPPNDGDWMYANTLDIDPRNRANWPQMIEWLHNHLIKYRRAVAAAEASAATDKLPSKP